MVWLRAGMLVVGVAACAVRGLCADAVTGRYLWPLEDHVKVSSGFCDWRPRHYHGGIDIATEGREGLSVRAADSGWVMRVSVSYWGYGKAVYLQMSDGRIAVYGHLSEFAPPIQKYVEHEQYASRRYRQNLFPAPGELPIRRGEVIGETGQTGSGPPHLHFEIRTGTNRPLNPLVVGFDKPDAVAPMIRAVTIVPRPSSDFRAAPVTVNGSLAPITIDLEGPAGARYLMETPMATGAVGLSILADDGVDGNKWDVSPYQLRAWVNDRPIAHVAYDSINYAHTHLIDLERRVDPSPGYNSRSVNLFRCESNVLWHYLDLRDDGWLVPGETLIPGANVVRVEVADVAGNTSSAEFGLMLVEGTSPPNPSRAETAPAEITCRPSEGDLIITVPTTPGGGDPLCYRDSACTDPIRGVPVSGGSSVMVSADEGLETIWIGSGGGTASRYALPWVAVRREEGGTVTSSDGNASVTVGPDDLYRSTYMALSPKPFPGHPQEPITPLYEFAPLDGAFAREVRLTVSYGAVTGDPAKVAVYRFKDRARGWDFEGADRDSVSGVITATISQPGAFALLADTAIPTIRYVRPGRGQATSNRRPTIRFEMFDDLSGIGSDEDVELRIEGQWVPVEYDPEQGVGKARPRWDLTPGDHRVEIVARDRMGNEEYFLRVLHIKK